MEQWSKWERFHLTNLSVVQRRSWATSFKKSNTWSAPKIYKSSSMSQIGWNRHMTIWLSTVLRRICIIYMACTTYCTVMSEIISHMFSYSYVLLQEELKLLWLLSPLIFRVIFHHSSYFLKKIIIYLLWFILSLNKVQMQLVILHIWTNILYKTNSQT
jgi:hypothetical protein